MSRDCVFCRIVSRSEPADIVFESKSYLAFMDKYPQSAGHLQLIPKTHYHWIYELPDMGEIFSLAQKITHAIIPVLGADHIALGTFGNEVPHAHIWIVPYYSKQYQIQEGRRSESRINQRQKLYKLIFLRLAKEVFV
ncbi:hypothetical protein A2154_02430 [Candidatus Gottesmanbacteria bacterium RBG_16_43_7]|uniref:HIT domain-containing protein n=1 Tax=Candidatus Gottesmanbacteria bacterium RBG_16_43_7 TaxID=1798373 RepID=A0A1F5ZBQ8_9BACT|nr:MAG: hypothetical protein A2154_02430 [Candidatus Gottesmanbacteria bacterium RBG_16_43_7]